MKEEPAGHSVRNALIIVLGIVILIIGFIVIRNILWPPQTVILPSPAAAQTDYPSSEPCAYVWASKDLPELTEELTTLYVPANIPDLQVRASAFGENCLNEDGSIREFLTRQTDLTYSLELGVSDRQVVGETIGKILEVLVKVPESQFPGSNTGDMTFQFIESNGLLTTVRGGREELISAYQAGKRGADLLTFLDFPSED